MNKKKRKILIGIGIASIFSLPITNLLILQESNIEHTQSVWNEANKKLLTKTPTTYSKVATASDVIMPTTSQLPESWQSTPSAAGNIGNDTSKLKLSSDQFSNLWPDKSINFAQEFVNSISSTSDLIQNFNNWKQGITANFSGTDWVNKLIRGENNSGSEYTELFISSYAIENGGNTLTIGATFKRLINGNFSQVDWYKITINGFQKQSSTFAKKDIDAAGITADKDTIMGSKAIKDKVVAMATNSPLISDQSVTITAVNDLNPFLGTCSIDVQFNQWYDTAGNLVTNHTENGIKVTNLNKVSTSMNSSKQVDVDFSGDYIHTIASNLDANKPKIADAIVKSGVIQNADGLTTSKITVNSLNETTREVNFTLTSGWYTNGTPENDKTLTVTLSANSFKPNITGSSALSPNAQSAIIRALPSAYPFEWESNISGALQGINDKLGNDPTQIASNVSINGYPSKATFSNLKVNGASGSVDVVITNWWTGGNTPNADSGTLTIPLTFKAKPEPINPEATVTPKPDSPLVQQAEQGSTVEEVQNNYADAMKNDIYTQIYDNCTTAQKAELDKLSPEQKKELLDSIQVDTTVEKNGDKLQITSSSINLKDFNSKLQAMGIQGFTQDSFEYTNPLPPAEDVLAWWAILLIVVGSLLIIGLIITLILYKKKNKGYKGTYAY